MTQNPRLQAGKDLLEVIKLLPIVSKKQFKFLLEKYLIKHKEFLNEKTTDVLTGPSHSSAISISAIE